MKKFFGLCGLAMLLLFGTFGASAQAPRDGTWAGKLTVSGVSLSIVVHLKGNDGGYHATMDSPDQGATGLAASKVTVVNDSLVLEIASAGAKLSGRFTSDTSFTGQWVQGVSLPLQLRKLRTGETVAGPRRPQTPKPPFPYKSVDVVYFNTDKSIQYGATVTTPQGNGPFPALVLITGSGTQDRDETIFGHKPFAVIADYLTRRGYVVLRVDDRGMGQTTGDTKNATSNDFADDVTVGLEYLKTLPQVNGKKLGLLGHSEGGMIAQIVAAQRTDVDFLILLAAPGQRIIDLMTEQNRAILSKNGMPPAHVSAYLRLYRPLALAVASAPTDSAAQLLALPIVNNWVKQTPKDAVRATTGIESDESKKAFAESFTREVRLPWFRYFLQYNPDAYVHKLKANVLALNGSEDIQVAAKPNLAALKASLKKGGNNRVEAVELQGLNHLFQRCRKCTIAEYAELEETMAPEALELIGKWLSQNVK